MSSPEARIEDEVWRALDAEACLQERLEAVALPAEAVDDVGA